jgi:BASS family bile acid:Na+ symporter
MRGKDLLLIGLALAGAVLGVMYPRICGQLSPFVLYGMMIVLFMSFVRIDFAALAKFSAEGVFEAAFWIVVKLVLLPVCLWALAMWLQPAFALPVLLLAGTSTGVTAPFFGGLLGAQLPRILQLLVGSSLLVPLTLPALVKLLLGEEISIPFSHLFRMLLLVIFLPLLAALMTKKLIPGLVGILDRTQYPISVSLFFIINLGVFAQYASFVRDHEDKVLMVLAVAFVLGLAFLGAGFLLGKISRHLNPLTGLVGLCFINNILTLVFAARFFGPEASLLAAAYMFPALFVLLPLRWLALNFNNQS